MSNKASSFNVYNASAGSGKTFALVKAYLKLLLGSERQDLFRSVLALTFTNKAVAEMKTRIINTLREFSDEGILTEPNSMFSALADELDMVPKAIHLSSKRLLFNILHNYASFDISTIDRFTHKVIRTFAYDLGIPMNFQVELDTDSILAEAVDNLIAKAGEDSELTRILVDFAIEKADDDRSWDIALDFNKAARSLVNENDIPYLASLKDKTVQHFMELKSLIKSRSANYGKEIKENASNSLDLISSSGLQPDDFKRGSLPRHFENLANGKFGIGFDSKWQQELEEAPLYPNRVPVEVATTIDTISQDLIGSYQVTKALVYQHRFLQNFLKNITPLSVINAINKELQSIKEENDLLLITEFNKTIFNEIRDQPTPFIYERLGEKFKHYFIDEFQDTSELQWKNLIPLIDNRLSSEEGSAMVVGDAKQSIYRWRGGKPEMFMAMMNGSNPFQVEKSLFHLPINYRSCKSIVRFNNSFFKHLSSFAFHDPVHSRLYAQASQDEFLSGQGYVNIEFLDDNTNDPREDLYPEAVRRTIDDVLSHGFNYRDICILTRKKMEGILVADHLNQHGIEILSSETLQVQRSPEVNFVNGVLQLAMNHENKELKVNVLYFIAELTKTKDIHAFLCQGLDKSLNDLPDVLKPLGITFDFNFLLQCSLFDAAEYIVRSFSLVTKSDAYLQFYLDIVLDFTQTKSSSIRDFLEYWEKKKNTFSIAAPEGKDAVTIMTIHKSKGLEFPVVIFPFADLNIYKEKEPKTWFPINPDKHLGFQHALLNFNKDISGYGDMGQQLYEDRRSDLELDNINLLYVTLTRAVEQLHIITIDRSDAKGNDRLDTYSGLFMSYLKSIDAWRDNKASYSFGDPVRHIDHEKLTGEAIVTQKFISTRNKVNIVTKSGYLWDSDQGKAIEKGNLVHEILSRILVPTDLEFVLDEALTEGMITTKQSEELAGLIKNLVHHPELERYFSNEVIVHNERDIIADNGSVVRPDRLVVDNHKKATIIDYKTGAFDRKHAQQLITYGDIIASMDLQLEKRLLVYINDDIIIKEV